MNADRRAKNKKSDEADASCQHELVCRMEACRLRVVMHPRLAYWFRKTTKFLEAEDKGQNGINVPNRAYPSPCWSVLCNAARIVLL